MEHPSQADDEEVVMSKEERAALESICDDVIDSVCIDVACGMHRMIKTGVVPYADLMIPSSRQEVYPTIPANDDGASKTILNYPSDESPSKRARLATSSGDEQTREEATTSAVQTRGSVNNTDIWGRIPPKEPKYTVKCPVCARQVSTLRFAPHLDKCMGIGTTARGGSNGANTNNSGTRSSAK